MLRYLNRLICFACLFALCGWSGATTLPVQRGHVSDYANVLGAQRSVLEARLQAHQAATGQQVLVLTVDSTDGEPIDSYAVAVFGQWKPGRKDVDDGVLLVIATKDRRMRIEVGYGLEGELTDVESARILRDVMAPALKEGKYDVAVEQGLNAILKELGGQAATSDAADAERPASSAMPAWLLAMLLFFGAFLFGMSLFLGIVGLILAAALTVALPQVLYPDWRAWLFGALCISLWLFGRWKMLAANVRKYRLPGAANPAMTWLRYYLFSFGFSMGRPLGKREQKERESGRSSNRSSSSGSNKAGAGGRSGGGGASGSW